MYLVNQTKEGISSLPAKEISGDKIKIFGSKLSQRIIKELSKKDCYPKEIARILKENEQKIYYHIRRLEKGKIIHIVGKKVVSGANANIYSLKHPAFFIKFKEFETTKKIMEYVPEKYLDPFIDSGSFNSTIIVGSPDPHGPQKARSRDGYYAIDLGLFFGTHLNYVPRLNVKLDTEVRSEDLQNNLIVIGGPIVNTISSKINTRFPVRFDERDNLNIFSTVTGKTYMSDETGIIVKDKNPFNKNKSVLMIAGKRHSGTRAVMIAFLNYFHSIIEGNNYNEKVMAKIVEGVDLDSDGIVDDIEFLE